MVPLNGKGRFIQGIYTPKYRNKYIGKEVPVYRSGWELRFFRWCDNNPNVLEWASEAIVIPYTSPLDNRVHRYYTDGVIVLKENDKVKKYIVEIKPSIQVAPPVVTKRKKQSTLVYETQRYAVNIAKWAAARLWAANKGYTFQILTEKEIGV